MITKETGLGYDVSEAVAKLCDCDRMAAVVDRVGPCRLVANKRLSLFAAMMRSITRTWHWPASFPIVRIPKRRDTLSLPSTGQS